MKETVKFSNARVGDTAIFGAKIISVDAIGRADCHLKVEHRGVILWVLDSEVVRIERGIVVGDVVTDVDLLGEWTVVAVDAGRAWIKGVVSGLHETRALPSLTRA